MEEEYEEVCGEAFDHELYLIGEDEYASTYECTNCGAEIWEDKE